MSLRTAKYSDDQRKKNLSIKAAVLKEAKDKGLKGRERAAYVQSEVPKRISKSVVSITKENRKKELEEKINSLNQRIALYKKWISNPSEDQLSKNF